jgi:hypothetical protein
MLALVAKEMEEAQDTEGETAKDRRDGRVNVDLRNDCVLGRKK